MAIFEFLSPEEIKEQELEDQQQNNTSFLGIAKRTAKRIVPDIKPRKTSLRPTQGRRLAPQLTKEQAMLHDIFSGQSFWGLPHSDCLPQLNFSLFGRLKNPNDIGTASLFGFGKI